MKGSMSGNGDFMPSLSVRFGKMSSEEYRKTLGTTASMLDQADDLLGGILEIVIHDHYVVAARLLQPCHGGVVLAKVLSQLHIGYRFRVHAGFQRARKRAWSGEARPCRKTPWTRNVS